MTIRTRILKRRAKFIAAAMTLSCGGVSSPTDAGPEDAALHDGARKDGGADAEADADALADAELDAKDAGPQPCLAPM